MNEYKFVLFSNDGNIFLKEKKIFQCTKYFERLVKSYTVKFTAMFENMLSFFVVK